MNLKLRYFNYSRKISKTRLSKGKEACIEAKKMRAGIALFPGMRRDRHVYLSDKFQFAGIPVGTQSEYIRITEDGYHDESRMDQENRRVPERQI